MSDIISLSIKVYTYAYKFDLDGSLKSNSKIDLNQ